MGDSLVGFNHDFRYFPIVFKGASRVALGSNYLMIAPLGHDTNIALPKGSTENGWVYWVASCRSPAPDPCTRQQRPSIFSMQMFWLSFVTRCHLEGSHSWSMNSTCLSQFLRTWRRRFSGSRDIYRALEAIYYSFPDYWSCVLPVVGHSAGSIFQDHEHSVQCAPLMF